MPLSPTSSSPTQGRRAGATWVAATGAALVLVAAAVLVASRWDQLSDVFKLGLLASATGACTWAGYHLRRSLPATGNVLFHLGVLLVPANLAAVAIHLDASVGQHLFAQGLAGAVLFTIASIETESKVLRWVAIASVPVAAAGLGALTVVPALLALAAAAVAMECVDRRNRDAVIAWAGLVGFAPVILAAAFSVAPALATADFVVASGVTGEAWTWLAGLLAAGVLAWRADRERNHSLAGLAIVSVVLTAVTAVSNSQLNLEDGLLGAASAFLLVETLAYIGRDDSFWKNPLEAFALATELVAFMVGGVFSLFVVGFVVVSADIVVDATAAVTFASLASAWMVACFRSPKTFGLAESSLAVSTALAAAFVTGSPLAAAVVLAACSVGFVLVDRMPLLGVVGGPTAVALAASNRPLALGLGVTVAAALAHLSVRAARRNPADAENAIAVFAVVGAGASAVLAARLAFPADTLAFCLVAVALVAGLAVATHEGSRALGDLARAFLLVPVSVVDDVPRNLMLVGGATAAVLLADALRTRRPGLLGVGAAVSHIAVGAAAVDSGLTTAQSGIALAFAALVWTGIAGVIEDGWQRHLLEGAAVAAAAALYMAVGDTPSLAIVLLVLGGTAAAVGLLVTQDTLANAGGIAVSLGFVLQSAITTPEGLEFFLLPVAVHLAVAGEIVSRRRPISSWLSAAPGPVLFAGAALLERIDSGAAIHALAAAVVAGGAVAIGGSRRQAGPLLAGTAILGLLAVNESLAVLAGVPAWGWIGLVGAALIACAVMIERADTSPVEVGRRLVDEISDNFR